MNVYKSVEFATPSAPLADHTGDHQPREELTMTDYSVCETCGPAIVNDDYTAFDDEAELASVTAFIESVRDWLTVIGDTDYAGYWTCEACGQVCLGAGILLGVLA